MRLLLEDTLDAKDLNIGVLNGKFVNIVDGKAEEIPDDLLPQVQDEYERYKKKQLDIDNHKYNPGNIETGTLENTDVPQEPEWKKWDRMYDERARVSKLKQSDRASMEQRRHERQSKTLNYGKSANELLATLDDYVDEFVPNKRVVLPTKIEKKDYVGINPEEHLRGSNIMDMSKVYKNDPDPETKNNQKDKPYVFFFFDASGSFSPTDPNSPKTMLGKRIIQSFKRYQDKFDFDVFYFSNKVSRNPVEVMSGCNDGNPACGNRILGAIDGFINQLNVGRKINVAILTDEGTCFPDDKSLTLSGTVWWFFTCEKNQTQIDVAKHINTKIKSNTRMFFFPNLDGVGDGLEQD